MTDVRSLLQTTLDGVLVADKIYAHWGEKAEVPGESDIYVVYSIGDDSNPDWADDMPWTRSAYSIISLWYPKTYLKTVAGREKIKGYEESIKSALVSVDFVVSSSDDIDPADAYARVLFEASYGEEVF